MKQLFLGLIIFCKSVMADDIFAPSRMANDFISPVTNAKSRNVLLAGIGFSIIFAATKKNFGDPVRKSLNKNQTMTALRPLGDFGGSGLLNGLYVAGMLADFAISDSRRSLANATLMSEATLYSAALAYGLKSTVNEPRPDRPNERDSFPSGSSTLAFSWASYIGARHSLSWGAAAYTLASLTALSRLNRNRHHLHDISAGITLGTVYGLGIYTQNFKKKSVHASRDNFFPTLMAWVDSEGIKVSADMNF